MRITFIMVGKTTSEHIAKLSSDYVTRLNRYLTFEEKIIPEIKNAKSMPNNVLRDKEGESILKLVSKEDTLILLDDKGKQYTSLEFAKWIEEKQNASTKRVIFVVGGAYGFSREVYNRANGFLSISKMTFSHQIIRPIFLEQLYRAMTINKNEPYHHEESLFYTK